MAPAASNFPFKPYQQLGKILFKVKPQPILSNFMLIINSQLPGLPANQMCNIQYKDENQSPFDIKVFKFNYVSYCDVDSLPLYYSK